MPREIRAYGLVMAGIVCGLVWGGACDSGSSSNAGGPPTMMVNSITAGAGLTATPTNPITDTGTLSIATDGVTGAHVSDGTLTAADADTSSLQARVTGVAPGGEFITAINADGSVITAPDASDWKHTGNAGLVDGTDFFGTTDTAPLNFRVNNLRVARFEPGIESPNIVIGHRDNSVAAGVSGASISGGGYGTFSEENTITSNYGTIGGGKRNRVGGAFPGASPTATVAGGSYNTASGVSTFIGGGYNNTASGQSSVVGGGNNNISTSTHTTVGGGNANEASGLDATVGGGAANIASGNDSTVAGGSGNVASGQGATVPGGFNNLASGQYSFAAGRTGQAVHDGTFVWADTSPFTLASTAADQFLVRAAGGAIIYTNSTSGSGVSLAAGGSAWAAVSDRASKENIEQVDGRETLKRLAEIEISTWNYKAQDDSVRHIGPMAQDFHAAFGVGGDEKRITTLDADGVALSAIQGLYEIIREKDRKIDALDARLRALERRMSGK